MLPEMRIPQSIVAALTHDIFIIGCQVNYSLDKPTDVEVSSLYPDTSFRTIDECFKDFARLVSDTPKVVNKPKSNDAIIVPNSKPEALAITAAWARLICYYIILNVFQALPMLLCDLSVFFFFVVVMVHYVYGGSLVVHLYLVIEV